MALRHAAAARFLNAGHALAVVHLVLPHSAAALVTEEWTADDSSAAEL